MTLLHLVERFPLIGPLWSWAAQDPERLVYALTLFILSTIGLFLVLWVNEDVGYTDVDYVFFRKPVFGLTGDQIRGALSFPLLLPLTFHLAPLLLAGMLLYHLGRVSLALGRMAAGVPAKAT